MKIINKYLVILSISVVILLSSCSSQSVNVIDKKNSQWDFDHKLQFKQTKIGENSYRIEVVRTNKVTFSQMTTFLIRHSNDVCGAYGYSIKVLGGVEMFTDKQAMPNLIMRSLIAEVNC